MLGGGMVWSPDPSFISQPRARSGLEKEFRPKQKARPRAVGPVVKLRSELFQDKTRAPMKTRASRLRVPSTLRPLLISSTIALVFLFTGVPLFSQTPSFLEGEKLWVGGDHTASVKAFRRALAEDPTNALVNALLCRGLFEVGELLPNSARKEQLALYEEMIAVAGEGLKKDPKSGENHFMRALGMGRRATVKGILNSLRYGAAMEKDWLMSLKCPMDYTSPNGMKSRAEALHALGLFYRLAPDANLLQWLFGFKGDMEKAISYDRAAAALQPDQVEVILELGAALVAQGLEKKRPALVAEGRQVLQNVLSMAVTKKTDAIDKRHARMLLDHPDMCRDYDRQGQQERDLKKAPKGAPKS